MLKRIFMILMLVGALLVGGFMTTYDLTHATTIKNGITNTTTKGSLALAKDYCKKYCKDYRIKVVTCVPKQRNDGKHVYIEKVATTSTGDYWGKTKEGYTIKYNKKVKKHKKVMVYLVYNPSNNALDDVIAKACNHIVKGDKKHIKAPAKVNCPCCGDGASTDCVYYIHNESRHMTESEIEAFNWSEWHYICKYGNEHERNEICHCNE